MGARGAGLTPTLRDRPGIDDAARYDVAAFYGMTPAHRATYDAFVAADRPVVVCDLAYWDRSARGMKYECSYKVAVGYWHPTRYFQRVPKPADRLMALRVRVQPTRKRVSEAPILLVGMSQKGCDLYGIELLSWEREAVRIIREQTSTEIIYRPKAAVRKTAIPGTTWQDPETVDMANVLRRGHWSQVVTHHSNAAIEAIVEGIPVIVADGAALPLSGDLRQVCDPRYVSTGERTQLCRDLAYCQWNTSEMRAGVTWRHLLSEGLLRSP